MTTPVILRAQIGAVDLHEATVVAVDTLQQPSDGGLPGAAAADAGAAGRLMDRLGPDSAVVALAPAIVEQAALIDLTSQQMVMNANVLALAPDFPPALGALTRPNGEPLDLGGLAADEIYVNADAAAQLGAEDGDTLRLRLGEQALEVLPRPLRLTADRLAVAAVRGDDGHAD